MLRACDSETRSAQPHHGPFHNGGARPLIPATQIALQAESRNCRLHPTTLAYEPSKVEAPAAGTRFICSDYHDGRSSSILGSSSSRKTASRRTPSPEPAPRKHSSPHKTKDRGKETAREEARSKAGSDRYKRKAEEAEEEIEALKAELEKAQRNEPSKLLPSQSTSP